MKKKVLIVIIILITLLVFSAPALADTTTYHLKELYMDVDIPDNGDVFTREMRADDPIFIELGLPEENAISIIELLNESSTYLIYRNPYYVIHIQKFEHNDSQEIFNFNLCTDEDLNTFATNKMNLTDYKIYSYNNIKYLVFNLQPDNINEIDYRVSYLTAHNGQAISIVFGSYYTPLTPEMTNELKAIVDSIVFTETLEYPEITDSSNSDQGIFTSVFGTILSFTILITVWAVFKSRRQRKSNKEKEAKTQIEKEIAQDDSLTDGDHDPSNDED